MEMLSPALRRTACLTAALLLATPATAFVGLRALEPLRAARYHRSPRARIPFVFGFDDDDFHEPSKRSFAGSTYASAETGPRAVTYERMADDSLAGWLTIGTEKHESAYVGELKALVLEHFGGTVVESLSCPFTFDPVYIDVKLDDGQTITLHSYENMGVCVMATTRDPNNEAAVRRVADRAQQLGVF